VTGGLPKSRQTAADIPQPSPRGNLGRKQRKEAENGHHNAPKGLRATMPRVWGDLASRAERPWEAKGVLQSTLSADLALSPRTGGRATGSRRRTSRATRSKPLPHRPMASGPARGKQAGSRTGAQPGGGLKGQRPLTRGTIPPRICSRFREAPHFCEAPHFWHPAYGQTAKVPTFCEAPHPESPHFWRKSPP